MGLLQFDDRCGLALTARRLNSLETIPSAMIYRHLWLRWLQINKVWVAARPTYNGWLMAIESFVAVASGSVV